MSRQWLPGTVEADADSLVDVGVRIRGRPVRSYRKAVRRRPDRARVTAYGPGATTRPRSLPQADGTDGSGAAEPLSAMVIELMTGCAMSRKSAWSVDWTVSAEITMTESPWSNAMTLMASDG